MGSLAENLAPPYYAAILDQAQDDLGTANALGMVSYLLAMGVAGYYLRTITVKSP